MEITCNITLSGADTFGYTPDDAATQVLAALGGDPASDHCLVNVAMPSESGSAGTPREEI
jgi:hypothetical protein